MYVKPKPGLRIYDPTLGRYLPEAGAEVPESTFWLRCLQAGDVIAIEPPTVVTTELPIPDSGPEE